VRASSIQRFRRTECHILAAAKHEAFLKARGRHYSNEAEAMKVSTCLDSYSSPFVLCALISWILSVARGQAYGGRRRGVAKRRRPSSFCVRC
jgi:hypothetical protein